VSGRDAETKVRGRLKEKESADREKRENEEKLRKEMTEKYDKWNKGCDTFLLLFSFAP
jgi:hypothetical protein